MNICIRVSIEYKMPMSEVRRCLTIKFTILFILVTVAVAQSPETNSITGPLKANGGSAAEFRKYKIPVDFLNSNFEFRIKTLLFIMISR